jgi:hypothetical protein
MSFSGLGLSAKPDFDPWVDGSKLIVPVGKALPNRCVTCGQPAQKSFKRKFTSSPSGTTPFMLGGIIGLLVTSRNKETFSLAVPLCPQHEASFKQRRQAALIALCAGVAISGIAIFVQRPVLFLAGIVLAAGGGLASSVVKPCPRLKAILINESLAEFEGASENFLSQMKAGGDSNPK